jgi:4-amino-4-deoxy-L-arabinose transferase-like glycosyltransferase
MRQANGGGGIAWGLMLALAVAGQISALSLMHAPPYAVYQHYWPWSDIADRGLLQAAIIVLELVTALLVLRRDRALVEQGVRVFARPVRVVLAATVVLFISAVPAGSAAGSLREVGTSMLVLAASTLMLLALSFRMPDSVMEPLGRRVRRWISLPGESSPPGAWDRLLPGAVACWVTLVALGACWFAFERLPHIDDSVSYLFQAKYFSAGHLFLPSPPDSTGFAMSQTLNDGTKWWAYGFPGWPAMLSLGVRIGLPWVVNPLLGGATILLAHAVVRRLYDWGTANLTVLLLGVSPWFLYMSGEFMGHPLSVVCTLIAVLAVLRSGTGHAWAWMALAGAALGALFLTRPIEAFLVAPVVGGWAIAPFGARVRLRQLVPLVAAGALVAAISLPYSAALTGDPTYPPHTKWADATYGAGRDRIGFGRDVGHAAWPNIDPLPGHGLPDVVLNTNKNLYMTNVELFGWSCGSLLLILAAFVAGGWDRRDVLALALAGSGTLGYSIYWFNGGPDLGARYWYQALVPLVLLTARAAAILGGRLGTGARTAAPRVGAFIALATVTGFLTFMPWRFGKYHEYRGVSGAIRRLASANAMTNALVFLRSADREDYQSAFSLNPSTLSGPGTVYVWDRNPMSRAGIVTAFPGRPVWVIERGSAPGDTIEVKAGPLAPGTVPP